MMQTSLIVALAAAPLAARGETTAVAPTIAPLDIRSPATRGPKPGASSATPRETAQKPVKRKGDAPLSAKAPSPVAAPALKSDAPPTPAVASTPDAASRPAVALRPALADTSLGADRRLSHRHVAAATPAPEPTSAAPTSAKADARIDSRPVAALAERAPTLAGAYCKVVQDEAQEARAAYQARKLAEMEARLAEQIERLERRQDEYRVWFEKQEQARRKAEDSVAAILARMRPDAAAAQLAVMDETSASALLAKMNARNASAVLNEMPAAKAARLAGAMTPAPPARGTTQ